MNEDETECEDQKNEQRTHDKCRDDKILRTATCEWRLLGATEYAIPTHTYGHHKKQSFIPIHYESEN